VDEYAYLKQPFKHFENLEPMVAEPVKETVEEPDEPIHCYKCDTPLVDAPGIGLFCPNKECDVVDNTIGEEPIELVADLPKEKQSDRIEIQKDNVFILDEVTGETMPAIPSRKLEPKYDYEASFAFVEKANNKIDGGSF
jgi:uncharacterized Zn finger protein (UPF0148 family)